MKTLGPKSFGFFYTGPAVRLLKSNFFFISLQHPALGFLTTPPQGYQELPDVARVILIPKLLVDYFGYPL